MLSKQNLSWSSKKHKAYEKLSSAVSCGESPILNFLLFQFLTFWGPSPDATFVCQPSHLAQERSADGVRLRDNWRPTQVGLSYMLYTCVVSTAWGSARNISAYACKQRAWMTTHMYRAQQPAESKSRCHKCNYENECDSIALLTAQWSTYTAEFQSLHPNMCIAVHCSSSPHPQLPWYHESPHHWGLCDKFLQLSARGIATCFASAQVSGGVDCLSLCLPSKSKSNSNHSGKLSGGCKWLHWKQGLAGCTNFASTDSKACSTSKLLVFCETALANSTLLCFTN